MTFDNMFTRGVRRMKFNTASILTSVTHSLFPAVLYAKQNEGYLRMRKILIEINFYFLTKIWQMRNVSTQNRGK